jgi:hypothetical protein
MVVGLSIARRGIRARFAEPGLDRSLRRFVRRLVANERLLAGRAVGLNANAFLAMTFPAVSRRGTAHALVTAARIAAAVTVSAATTAAAAATVFFFLVTGGACVVFKQRLPVGDRDLIVVRMDFAEREEAVPVAAVIDERRLKRRFDARNLG